jgi:hypothetical protein
MSKTLIFTTTFEKEAFKSEVQWWTDFHQDYDTNWYTREVSVTDENSGEEYVGQTLWNETFQDWDVHLNIVHCTFEQCHSR